MTFPSAGILHATNVHNEMKIETLNYQCNQPRHQVPEHIPGSIASQYKCIWWYQGCALYWSVETIPSSAFISVPCSINAYHWTLTFVGIISPHKHLPTEPCPPKAVSLWCCIPEAQGQLVWEPPKPCRMLGCSHRRGVDEVTVSSVPCLAKPGTSTWGCSLQHRQAQICWRYVGEARLDKQKTSSCFGCHHKDNIDEVYFLQHVLSCQR